MSRHEPLSDQEVFTLFPNVMINHDNIAHYRALAAGHLLINRCQDCGYWIYPHRPLCSRCLSWNVAPTEVGGQGRIFMFTLIHQLRDPDSVIAQPVVAAAIELSEQAGLRYLARIVNCPLDAITLDMPVSLTWIDDGARLLPAFEPASGLSSATHG
jgi:uncharacterized OB-fold protein